MSGERECRQVRNSVNPKEFLPISGAAHGISVATGVPTNHWATMKRAIEVCPPRAHACGKNAGGQQIHEGVAIEAVAADFICNGNGSHSNARDRNPAQSRAIR
jgi:hypothetical protein